MARLLQAVALLLCNTPVVFAQGNAASNVLETVRIARDVDSILVPVTFKGRTYGFLFDTGSNHTVFDVRLRSLLGQSTGVVDAKTANGSIKVDVFQPAAATVGRIELQTNRPLGTLDLRGVRESSGCPVRGILGMDFLSHFLVRIDWGKGELAFLRSLGTDAGTPLDLTTIGGCPYVRLHVDGWRDENFLIDTGNVGLSGSFQSELYRELASRRCIANSGTASEVSVSGRGQTSAGRLGTLGVGPFRHANLLFSEGNHTKIGISVLSRYIVTFDFPNQRMYVKPGALFHQPEYVDCSGLSLIERDDKVLVQSIRVNSVAHRRGLRPSDEIVSVDGMKANEMRLFALRHLLCEPGRKVRFTVRRNGEEYLAEMTLQ